MNNLGQQGHLKIEISKSSGLHHIKFISMGRVGGLGRWGGDENILKQFLPEANVVDISLVQFQKFDISKCHFTSQAAGLH